jgi:hypothetical protein
MPGGAVDTDAGEIDARGSVLLRYYLRDLDQIGGLDLPAYGGGENVPLLWFSAPSLSSCRKTTGRLPWPPAVEM